MTHDAENREHPSDEVLAAWVDARIGSEAEPVEAGRGFAAHLAHCAFCRARVAAIEGVVAALRAEPPAPDPAELADRAARVLAVIRSQPRARVVRLRVRRWWWVPAAAAAALVALLLARPGGDGRGPAEVAEGPGGERAAGAAPLPVVAAAREAADEAAAVIEGAAESVEGSTDIDASMLGTETLSIPGAVVADLALVEEFATLPAEDQNAILDELAAMELEL